MTNYLRFELDFSNPLNILFLMPHNKPNKSPLTFILTMLLFLVMSYLCYICVLSDAKRAEYEAAHPKLNNITVIKNYGYQSNIPLSISLVDVGGQKFWLVKGNHPGSTPIFYPMDSIKFDFKGQ